MAPLRALLSAVHFWGLLAVTALLVLGNLILVKHGMGAIMHLVRGVSRYPAPRTLLKTLVQKPAASCCTFQSAS